MRCAAYDSAQRGLALHAPQLISHTTGQTDAEQTRA
jgi:hypothetical protein